VETTLRFLIDEVHIAPDLAKAISPYVRELPDDILASELSALQERESVGGPSIIVSRHPRNLLIKWKELLFSVVPAIAGAVAALYTKPVSGSLACLAALVQLSRTADIELKPEHGQVVAALWRNFEGQQQVSVADLHSVLPQIPRDQLDRILGDLAVLGIVQWFGIQEIVKKDRLLLAKQ